MPLYTQEMKKKLSFWPSLEVYLHKLLKRSPLPHYWPDLVVGLFVVVILLSLWGAKNSMAGVSDLSEATALSAKLGDYELAQKLFDQGEVLGLEDKVFPEKMVVNKIAELEQKLEDYPGNKVIFTSLAELYEQLGNQEAASEYREKARVLDPNRVEF